MWLLVAKCGELALGKLPPRHPFAFPISRWLWMTQSRPWHPSTKNTPAVSMLPKLKSYEQILYLVLHNCFDTKEEQSILWMNMLSSIFMINQCKCTRKINARDTMPNCQKLWILLVDFRYLDTQGNSWKQFHCSRNFRLG